MKKLATVLVMTLGLTGIHSAFAASSSLEIPGLMSLSSTTGSVVGNFMASQVAMGNAQTAVGGVELKMGGFSLTSKASNTINKISINGSTVGNFMASQVAMGNAQTAMGAASNTINSIGIE